ncbi:hypothetical protein F4779DRAFT_307205 [Xylariaceae sp. FL0662B]|nr:hypothetical protein F4779DRAFT_307205 [Xylariaceae sp. FL0662B]
MKARTLAAALAPSSLASAQWWHGAPECAQSCLSSAYAAATSTANSSWWPAQSDYCDGNSGSGVASCISSGCSATLTAYTSYSALSESLCSRYASCTSAGSTGVQTITYAGGPVTWAAPGGWGSKGEQQQHGGPPESGFGNGGEPPQGGPQWGGPNDSAAVSRYWSEWASASTWSGGVATVTGCAFDGSPWFVGPHCGWNSAGGFNGWVGWGSGWSWGPTTTETVTYTTTDTAGVTTTGTGLATVAMAISGSLTTSTTVGALATGAGGAKDENAAARAGFGGHAEGDIVPGLLGIGLGAVVVVAGML